MTYTEAQIKAEIDKGKLVHWSNTGYVCYKCVKGKYWITFESTKDTVALESEYFSSDTSDKFFVIQEVIL